MDFKFLKMLAFWRKRKRTKKKPLITEEAITESDVGKLIMISRCSAPPDVDNLQMGSKTYLLLREMAYMKTTKCPCSVCSSTSACSDEVICHCEDEVHQRSTSKKVEKSAQTKTASKKVEQSGPTKSVSNKFDQSGPQKTASKKVDQSGSTKTASKKGGQSGPPKTESQNKGNFCGKLFSSSCCKSSKEKPSKPSKSNKETTKSKKNKVQDSKKGSEPSISSSKSDVSKSKKGREPSKSKEQEKKEKKEKKKSKDKKTVGIKEKKEEDKKGKEKKEKETKVKIKKEKEADDQRELPADRKHPGYKKEITTSASKPLPKSSTEKYEELPTTSYESSAPVDRPKQIQMDVDGPCSGYCARYLVADSPTKKWKKFAKKNCIMKSEGETCNSQNRCKPKEPRPPFKDTVKENWKKLQTKLPFLRKKSKKRYCRSQSGSKKKRTKCKVKYCPTEECRQQQPSPKKKKSKSFKKRSKKDKACTARTSIESISVIVCTVRRVGTQTSTYSDEFTK